MNIDDITGGFLFFLGFYTLAILVIDEDLSTLYARLSRWLRWHWWGVPAWAKGVLRLVSGLSIITLVALLVNRAFLYLLP